MKKTIEFEDAPSGQIMLYNYKEPFMEFFDKATGEGYGYEGVLVADAGGDVVQCHFCGKWFSILQWHIKKEHNLNAKLYKEKTGLTQSTALISENYREKLVLLKRQRGNLGKNLRPGGKHTEETKKKIGASLKKNVREIQNTKGTCPLQLKYKFMNLWDKLGRQPTSKEYERQPNGSNRETCIKVFGSWDKFVAECGGKRLSAYEGSRKSREKNTLKKTQEMLENLTSKYGVNFQATTLRKEYGMSKSTSCHWYKKIKKLPQFEIVKKDIKKAEKEQTVRDRLNDLRIFVEVNKRYPGHSDFKRKLIGTPRGWYYYHYNSIKKALDVAQTI
jgi:hypothetical protein